MEEERKRLDMDTRLVPEWIPPEIDTTKAHPARIYEYMLGGKHFFDIDRDAAEIALKHVPQGRQMALENRAFLGRAIRFVAASGVAQFLDIGSGLPGKDNTGDVARAVRPETRVVYVDYDPMVAVHSRALLAGADPTRTAVVLADVRKPEAIFDDPELRRVIDFDEPVAVMMGALLHFVSPAEDAHGIVRAFVDKMAPGSALILSHLTDGGQPDKAAEAKKAWDSATSHMYVRTREEIEALFAGTRVVEPGIVPRPLWRPEGEVRGDWESIWGLAGVGIKD